MKKLLIIVFITISTIGIAQKSKNEKNEEFTPEQKAIIMSKKMRNSLDLTEQQTNEIKTVLFTKISKTKELREQFKAKKESGIKLSNDERFKLQNAMLDEKQAIKQAFKIILSAEQYKKFEEQQTKRQEKRREKKNFRKEKIAE